MKKYKATLYESEFIDVPAKPIDSILLDKICYTTAEKIFYDERGWIKSENYHIEIESKPRFLA